jgi:hypothetical protein
MRHKNYLCLIPLSIKSHYEVTWNNFRRRNKTNYYFNNFLKNVLANKTKVFIFAAASNEVIGV